MPPTEATERCPPSRVFADDDHRKERRTVSGQVLVDFVQTVANVAVDVVDRSMQAVVDVVLDSMQMVKKAGIPAEVGGAGVGETAHPRETRHRYPMSRELQSVQAAASLSGGCCPDLYGCATDSCYATTAGYASACGQVGYFACGADVGGKKPDPPASNSVWYGRELTSGVDRWMLC